MRGVDIKLGIRYAAHYLRKLVSMNMQRRTVVSEYELLEQALEDFQRKSGLSLVFGGIASADGVQVTALRGQLTGTLAGLHVRTSRGLGGRVIAERRPQLTSHYGKSRSITHDYDRAVLGEGVRSLIAVPVELEGEMRAVLYGGQRSDAPVGEVSLVPAERAAAELRRKFAARDAVRRAREQAAQAREAVTKPIPLPNTHLERLRQGYAELRAIGAEVTDAQLRQRLAELEHQLIGIAHPGFGAETTDRPTLSPRELDVLGYVALGWRNADIASSLGLTQSTVKSYLGSVMHKLGQPSRVAAVAAARRAGLLP